MDTVSEQPVRLGPSTSPPRILDVGVELAASQDRQEILCKTLREVRKLARAEGGAIFMLQGDRLRLAASQSDRPGAEDALADMLGRTVPLSFESLVGFAAMTAQTVNVPDAYALPPDVPFHVRRDFDLATDRKTTSVLAIPIIRPPQDCIGVLELFNHIDENGRCAPFPDPKDLGILSLMSMAAVTLHNCLLQDSLKEAHMDTIMRLSMAAEYRDDDTGTHVCRIGHTSSLIARALSLDVEQVDLIFASSPMHDVGKIGIPDRVLLKPGRLTDDERTIMQEHTWIGARILGRPTNELIASAYEIALSHHERWDGTGYPKQLAGATIPLAGRIVCVADVFDALVSQRCYKEAYPLDKALDILQADRAKNFDSECVDAFFCTLDDILEFYELIPSIQHITRDQIDD